MGMIDVLSSVHPPSALSLGPSDELRYNWRSHQVIPWEVPCVICGDW